jgi:hypothetical protein
MMRLLFGGSGPRQAADAAEAALRAVTAASAAGSR